MILAESAIQQSIYNALNGAILYNGIAVPIFDEFSENSAGFPRIIIQDIYNGPQQGSKDSFRSDCIAILKVSSAFHADANKYINDVIANEIAKILIPSPKGPFVSVDGFTVLLIQLQGTSVQSYQDQFYKYIDKNLRVQFTLEQKTLQ